MESLHVPHSVFTLLCVFKNTYTSTTIQTWTGSLANEPISKLLIHHLGIPLPVVFIICLLVFLKYSYPWKYYKHEGVGQQSTIKWSPLISIIGHVVLGAAVVKKNTVAWVVTYVINIHMFIKQHNSSNI